MQRQVWVQCVKPLCISPSIVAPNLKLNENWEKKEESRQDEPKRLASRGILQPNLARQSADLRRAMVALPALSALSVLSVLSAPMPPKCKWSPIRFSLLRPLRLLRFLPVSRMDEGWVKGVGFTGWGHRVTGYLANRVFVSFDCFGGLKVKKNIWKWVE